MDVSYRFASYFEVLTTEIHSCTGSTETGGEHLELRNNPQRLSSIDIATNGTVNEENLTAWFANLMSRKGTQVSNLGCWREREGDLLCSGTRTDTRGLVISIPVVLILRVPEDSNPPIGKFPQTLTPLTKTLGKRSGVIYDLVGFGLYSENAGHFTAQYLMNRTDVFSYDGMKNNGYAVCKSQGLDNHQAFPEGYTVNTTVYHLKGGLKAQRAFVDARKTDYGKRFNVDIAITDDFNIIPYCSYTGALVELSPEACFWIKPTRRPRNKEYVASIPDHKPNPPANVVKCNSPELTDAPTKHPPSPSSPVPSLLNSEFTVNCRCGANGDGNVMYQSSDGDDGAAVQCDECDEWSHIACQRDGRASLLKEKDRFICDGCDVLNILHPQYRQKEQDSGLNKRRGLM